MLQWITKSTEAEWPQLLSTEKNLLTATKQAGSFYDELINKFISIKDDE